MFEGLACFASCALVWGVATLAPDALAIAIATIAIAFALVTIYSEIGASQKDEDDDAT